jgi:hypothetical protein
VDSTSTPGTRRAGAARHTEARALIPALSSFRCCFDGRPRRTKSCGSVHDAIQPPAVGNALQLVVAGVLEDEAGSGHGVFHGVRDEDLGGSSQGRNSSRRGDRDAAGLLINKLAFARMNARRISIPRVLTRSAISRAQRIPRAGPSKVAKKPSPASFSTPRHRLSSSRTSA